MTTNLDTEGLSKIAFDYDLFYIDLWGVIHNGLELNFSAVETLKQLKQNKKEFVLLTNAPRPNETVKVFLLLLLLLISALVSGERFRSYEGRALRRRRVLLLVT